jgi:hypothetical protein
MLIDLSAPSARAGYVVDLTQQGSDVVATGSGAIDLSGLKFFLPVAQNTSLRPGSGEINTGQKNVLSDVYLRVTGPASFGSGGFTIASSGSGDLVGIEGAGGSLLVPFAYVSDSPLSDTATYTGQTFMSLGVTPAATSGHGGQGRTRTSRSSLEPPSRNPRPGP